MKYYTAEEFVDIYEDLEDTTDFIKQLNTLYGNSWRQILGELLVTIETVVASGRPDAFMEIQLPIAERNIRQTLMEMYNNLGKDLLVYLKVIYSDSRKVYNPDYFMDMSDDMDFNEGWATDGKTVTTRMEEHREIVIAGIMTALLIGLRNKQSKSSIIRKVEEEWRHAYKRSKLVVAGEVAYNITRAFKDEWEKQKVEWYEWSAILDLRTCPVCMSLDGTRYRLSEARVGDNYPPAHPRCRCYPIPIKNKDL